MFLVSCDDLVSPLQPDLNQFCSQKPAGADDQ